MTRSAPANGSMKPINRRNWLSVAYVTAVSASCSGVRRTFDSTPSYSASVPDSPSCEDDGLACQNVAKDTSRATMVMRKICPKIA
jgi:hypothetical protein